MRFQKKTEAWRRQEKALLADGAKRVPGSGNGFRKGDARGEVFLVQAKTTSKKQFSLKLDDLRKSMREAQAEERDMLMQVQLMDAEKYAVMRWETLLELLEKAGIPL